MRTDAVRSLAMFYGTGGLLCLLVDVLPHDPILDRTAVAAIGCAALGVATVLVGLRRLSPALLDIALVNGSALIALLIYAGHGADIALAFAGFSTWVVVFAAMFRPVPTAVLHVALAVATNSAVWATSGRPWPDFALVMVTGASTGLVVGQLIGEVRRAVDFDSTTGFLTARGLSTVGQNLLDAAGPGEQVAVLILQIHGWQQIIRSLGHDAAEAVMSRVAADLASSSSRELAEARLSGDRLVAVLGPAAIEDCRRYALLEGVECQTPTEVAVWMARSGLEHMRGPHEVAGVSLQLEGHVGVALSGMVEGGLDDLLRAGEAALADAVAADTPVELFDPTLARVDAEQLQMLAELRAGVADGQLRVHYQIQVGAHTGRTTGVEALVRWQHPTRGLLPPGVFLPLAETTDIIVDLTWAVLDDALGQCAAWLAQGFEVPVSVNLSARLLGHDGLVRQVKSMLAAHGLPARLLVLEVTETALISRPKRAAALLTELRAGGVRISLDDFGTGTTSLTLLAGVAFDEIKVDRSFVAACLTDPRAASIVRSIVNLGQALGLTVVAEGVEDAATGRWLAELGCDELQGFHYGRPRPPGELTDLPAVPVVPAATGLVYAGYAPVLPERWERERLAALHALDVLDTAPETALDDLATLAAQLCGTPMALISLVDADRQWFKSAIGCDFTESSRSASFCAHALSRTDVLEVNDARSDPRFADNPFVLGDPFVRFYAGAPLLTADGHVLGTLCVLDTVPKTLAASQRAGLRTLAASVAAKLQGAEVNH